MSTEAGEVLGYNPRGSNRRLDCRVVKEIEAMRSWGRALRLGLVAWLAPFLVAFVAFPFRGPARPLFESVMAVTVTCTAVLLGLVYWRRPGGGSVREGLLVGLSWFGMCILIDAPLMLLGGPMKMTFGEYMADIGLTYASIPVVTWGLAAARSLAASPERG